MTRNVPLSTARSFAVPKRKLVAAVCMLLISAIALITSTYAWYTLSVAPEARDISTSVAGNGSLEIALVPKDGDLTAITSGRAATFAGGTVAIDPANRTWGNLLDLSDPDYKIGDDSGMKLTPMAIAYDDNGDPVYDDAGHIVFTLPDFGYDGRNKNGTDAGAVINSYNATSGKFDSSELGVRAIIDEASVTAEDVTSIYGYVIDLAFRTNAADGKNLILEKEAIQRIYNDATDNPSTNTATQGEGSTLEFVKVTPGTNGDPDTEETLTSTYLNNAVRIAFIQDFANDDDSVTPVIIAYGKAGADGIDLYSDAACTQAIADNVLISNMVRNKVYQISVMFWLDGSETTSASYSSEAETFTRVKLNLQFATDTALVPYRNTDLHTPTAAPANPDEPVGP